MLKYNVLGIEFNFLPIAHMAIVAWFLFLILVTFLLPELSWVGQTIYAVAVILTTASFKSIDKFLQRKW